MLQYAGEGYLWNYENTNLVFGTNNQQRVTITNAGNVGIGETSPGSLLDVNGGVTVGNGTSYGVRTRANSGSGSWSILYGDSTNNVALDNRMGGDVWFGVGGSEYMRVKSGGNVGIGTTTPDNLLTVAGHVSLSGALKFDQTTSDYLGSVRLPPAQAQNCNLRRTM